MRAMNMTRRQPSTFSPSFGDDEEIATFQRRPSAIGVILAASDICGTTVLGTLPDEVIRMMELPELVTIVQADNRVMFHWATHPQPGRNDMRGDTATYQHLGQWVRAIVARPLALRIDAPARRYTLIGGIREPASSYPTISHMILCVKFVPRANASSGAAELWLDTFTPHSARSIKRYLRDALILSTTTA